MYIYIYLDILSIYIFLLYIYICICMYVCMYVCLRVPARWTEVEAQRPGNPPRYGETRSGWCITGLTVLKGRWSGAIAVHLSMPWCHPELLSLCPTESDSKSHHHGISIRAAEDKGVLPAATREKQTKVQTTRNLGKLNECHVPLPSSAARYFL